MAFTSCLPPLLPGTISAPLAHCGTPTHTFSIRSSRSFEAAILDNYVKNGLKSGWSDSAFTMGHPALRIVSNKGFCQKSAGVKCNAVKISQSSCEGFDSKSTSEETRIVLVRQETSHPSHEQFSDGNFRESGSRNGDKSSGCFALQTLGKEEAMGLVVNAAIGTGWTTGSGLEGPSLKSPAAPSFKDGADRPWPPLLSKSPRRRIAVEFTCNKCGERTIRAINPHAYKEGTVFVQCKGCDVFHKLVDHLGLFHDLKGPIYGPAYGTPDFTYHQPYDPFAGQNSDPFPGL